MVDIIGIKDGKDNKWIYGKFYFLYYWENNGCYYVDLYDDIKIVNI